MSDEEGKCSFGCWQCVCFNGLTEDCEPVLANDIGISGVSSQTKVEEMLGLELEADQIHWHWGSAWIG